MEYAWPYITLICFYGILALWYHYTNDATKKGIITSLCGVVFLVFFGFRGFCFYDWNVYYPSFQSIPADLQQALFNGHWYEPGFTVLVVICKSIYNNYHFFILICCFINTLLLLRFLHKYISNIPLGIIVFLCMGGLAIVTDLLRNSIAILIFMNAIEFIINRKPINYYVACIIAVLFHTSAILYLPLYLFLHKDWNKYIYAGIFVVGNMILLLKIPILISIVSLIASFLDPTTREHIDEYTRLLPSSSFQISIGYIERLFTGILIFFFYDKLKNIQKGPLFINCMTLFFIMYFALSEFKTISVRMSMLFAFAYIPIWIDFEKCIIAIRNKRLYLSMLCMYCLVKMYNSSNDIIYNYDNVLIEADTYNERKVIFQKNFGE